MSGIVYKKPAAELLQFANEDIITVSGADSWLSYGWDFCGTNMGQNGEVFRSDGTADGGGNSMKNVAKWYDGEKWYYGYWKDVH